MLYKVIGIMSGTSLDGVDLAYCEFTRTERWEFKLLHAKTISYDKKWKKALGEIQNGSASDLAELNCSYGNYLGELVKDFCLEKNLLPDFISSHGHTVFHQPDHGMTYQIGSGANLAARVGLPVVCDFRTQDVALGGQGAPLVPVGDRLLFSEFDFCLNLGGIANISYDENNKRIAYDVCECNLVLNYFSGMLGKDFDENGDLAKRGKPDTELMKLLGKLPYYSKPYPKSLGREDFENNLLPIFNTSQVSPENGLATFCHHIARQIAHSVNVPGKTGIRMLLTGGGALNSYLVDCIRNECNCEMIIPDRTIIEFKEAIIFGFLGVLRMRNEVNCLSSVTGAEKDSCSGAIY